MPKPIRYICGECGVKGVKLWREYQGFIAVLKCAACCEKLYARTHNGEKSAYARGTGDTIGWMVPAVPMDENAFWGYTSIPADRDAWWTALPDTEPTSDSMKNHTPEVALNQLRRRARNPTEATIQSVAQWELEMWLNIITTQREANLREFVAYLDRTTHAPVYQDDVTDYLTWLAKKEAPQSPYRNESNHA